MKYNAAMRSIEEIDAKIAENEAGITNDAKKRRFAIILSLAFFGAILTNYVVLIIFSPVSFSHAFKNETLGYLFIIGGLCAIVAVICSRFASKFTKRISRRKEVISSLREAKVIMLEENGVQLLCDFLDSLLAGRPEKPWLFALIEQKEYWIKYTARIAAYSWAASEAPEPEE